MSAFFVGMIQQQPSVPIKNSQVSKILRLFCRVDVVKIQSDLMHFVRIRKKQCEN